MMSSKLPAAREPIWAIDELARKTFLPRQGTPLIKAMSWLSELGDQPQMRLLATTVFALGLIRRDPRTIRAGARMLASHELATIAKSFVKHRIDRSRPRSASGAEPQQPHPGRSERKEDTSFPSGHSAGSMALALAFAAEYPEHRGKAIAAAGSVAVAQIPRCAHYPTDVAAGLAIGATAERIVAALFGALAAGLRA